VKALRLGTRGSQLALWQARAAAALVERAGGPPCEVVVIKTSGDRLAEAPLSEVGGKRLFVKEIEDALLRRDVDFAVHSCKDMPAVLPDGLVIGAVLSREDPRDVLVLPASSVRPATVEEWLAALCPGARIGTSSVRRVAELTRLLPGASFLPVRGNLDTRLKKLDAAGFDALALAAAGMRRLGFTERISFTLPVDACVPAPGQGAIAIEMRVDDRRTREALAAIDHPETASAVTAAASAQTSRAPVRSASTPAPSEAKVRTSALALMIRVKERPRRSSEAPRCTRIALAVRSSPLPAPPTTRIAAASPKGGSSATRPMLAASSAKPSA